MNNMTVKLPDGVQIDETSYSTTFGTISLGPLEKGYGRTLGNSLRRALLNAIPGSAIISIKVDGVNHEFSTITGVVEDVADFILNLKEVRLKMLDGNVEKISIDVKGKGTLTAADIHKNSPNIEVLNPGLHLATLNDDANFTLELRVERGRGYVPAEKNKKPESPIGTIYIDSIFTPVKFVNYEVESARVEGKSDFENLKINVETDGSITPDDAISQAAKVLRNHLNL